MTCRWAASLDSFVWSGHTHDIQVTRWNKTFEWFACRDRRDPTAAQNESWIHCSHEYMISNIRISTISGSNLRLTFHKILITCTCNVVTLFRQRRLHSFPATPCIATLSSPNEKKFSCNRFQLLLRTNKVIVASFLPVASFSSINVVLMDPFAKYLARLPSIESPRSHWGCVMVLNDEVSLTIAHPSGDWIARARTVARGWSIILPALCLKANFSRR
jgi:hypothetical protein